MSFESAAKSAPKPAAGFVPQDPQQAMLAEILGVFLGFVERITVAQERQADALEELVDTAFPVEEPAEPASPTVTP